MEEFLTAFWPNLAATVLGIAIGVPIALWLNRIAVGAARREELSAEKTQLLNACDVIEGILNFNNGVIIQYITELNSDQARWLLDLNTTTWGAVSADFSSNLTPPALRSRMSHQFGRVATLVWMNEQYLGFVFSINASMSNAAIAKANLLTNMIGLCNTLVVDNAVLLSILADLRKELRK
jgi:hypothetical protein